MEHFCPHRKSCWTIRSIPDAVYGFLFCCCCRLFNSLVWCSKFYYYNSTFSAGSRVNPVINHQAEEDKIFSRLGACCLSVSCIQSGAQGPIPAIAWLRVLLSRNKYAALHHGRWKNHEETDDLVLTPIKKLFTFIFIYTLALPFPGFQTQTDFFACPGAQVSQLLCFSWVSGLWWFKAVVLIRKF